MSKRKVIVAGWYTVDPGKRDEVVESCKDMVIRARNAPGCLDFAITADPVNSDRINMFEFWQSEKHLNSWRTVSKGPKKTAPMLKMEVQKHVIHQSGPPFNRRRKK
ncbi:MAG TPA: antibiotic biosynthesis monooxygenase family protein [Steroidobacteraceae bacterium]|nr:antibiotic biosynthesis monooxygenase family protein [Steroidobacteraceae bacterium]